MRKISETILKKTKKTHSGCWLWIGYTENGYGITNVKVNGKYVKGRVHRIIFEDFVGPIPDGLLCCHRCDTRNCVNPEHIFLGTHKDNYEDARSKNRIPRGEEMPQSKLTSKQVLEIRRLSKTHSTRELAALFGISSASHISKIIRGIKWSHI